VDLFNEGETFDSSSFTMTPALSSVMNVLITYFDRPDITPPYTQGMNYFAALAYYLYRDEAKAFWALQTIMDFMVKHPQASTPQHLAKCHPQGQQVRRWFQDSVL
jgi:hypothetical protein